MVAAPGADRRRRPTDAFHFHIEFHPPLRQPHLLKYLAGPEIGGGNFLTDTSPEEKAAELRRLPAAHYTARMSAARRNGDAAARPSPRARRIDSRAAISSTRTGPSFIARAPGRLDVMGGIADYSGSLVLEMPIASRAFAVARAVRSDGVTDRWSSESRRTAATNTSRFRSRTSSPTDPLRLRGARATIAPIRARRGPRTLLGALLVLQRETPPASTRRPADPAPIPTCRKARASARPRRRRGRGHARRVADLADVDLERRWRSRLARRSRTVVVGAPCGIMDQMTSALGRENQLLAAAAASRPRSRVTWRFPPASRSAASTPASATPSPAPTTARSAPARSWATASSPTPPDWPPDGRHRAGRGRSTTRPVRGYLANVHAGELATSASPAPSATRCRARVPRPLRRHDRPP